MQSGLDWFWMVSNVVKWFCEFWCARNEPINQQGLTEIWARARWPNTIDKYLGLWRLQLQWLEPEMATALIMYHYENQHVWYDIIVYKRTNIIEQSIPTHLQGWPIILHMLATCPSAKHMHCHSTKCMSCIATKHMGRAPGRAKSCNVFC